MERQFYVGLDLGQANDYSGLAVVERVAILGEWDAGFHAQTMRTELWLRHVERMRLGTPYPDVVARTRAVTTSLAARGRRQLIVDASGVGRPVVDLLRTARLECSILAVVITPGATQNLSGTYYHVPKRDLIAGVQVALQSKSLQIAARMKQAAVLVQELNDMRVRISSAGNETFGASGAGAHDDLVVALALSLWGARKAHPRCLNGETGYAKVCPGQEESWRGGG